MASATPLPARPPATAPTSAPTAMPSGPVTVPTAAPKAMPPAAAPRPTPIGCMPTSPESGSRWAPVSASFGGAGTGSSGTILVMTDSCAAGAAASGGTRQPAFPSRRDFRSAEEGAQARGDGGGLVVVQHVAAVLQQQALDVRHLREAGLELGARVAVAPELRHVGIRALDPQHRRRDAAPAGQDLLDAIQHR